MTQKKKPIYTPGLEIAEAVTSMLPVGNMLPLVKNLKRAYDTPEGKSAVDGFMVAPDQVDRKRLETDDIYNLSHAFANATPAGVGVAATTKAGTKIGKQAVKTGKKAAGVGMDIAQAVGNKIDDLPPIYAPGNKSAANAGGLYDTKMESNAKQYFGITKNPKEGLFIANDGSLLDGTGRNNGADIPGMKELPRIVDHSEISFVDGHRGMYDYMDKTNNIRFGLTGDQANIDIVRMPNQQQLKALENATRDAKAIYADITDPKTREVIASNQFPNFAKYKEWLTKQKFPEESRVAQQAGLYDTKYYHVSDNPNLKVDPNYMPRQAQMGKAFYVGKDPDVWRDSLGKRPYTYEVDTKGMKIAQPNEVPHLAQLQDWAIEKGYMKRDVVKRPDGSAVVGTDGKPLVRPILTKKGEAIQTPDPMTGQDDSLTIAYLKDKGYDAYLPTYSRDGDQLAIINHDKVKLSRVAQPSLSDAKTQSSAKLKKPIYTPGE